MVKTLTATQEIQLKAKTTSNLVDFEITMPAADTEADGYLEVKFIVTVSGLEEDRYIGRDETGVVNSQEIHYYYSLEDDETFDDSKVATAIYYAEKAAV